LKDAGNYGKTRKNTIIVQEILTIEQAQKKNMDTIEFVFSPSPFLFLFWFSQV
jgi:hypothetical protein